MKTTVALSALLLLTACGDYEPDCSELEGSYSGTFEAPTFSGTMNVTLTESGDVAPGTLELTGSWDGGSYRGPLEEYIGEDVSCETGAVMADYAIQITGPTAAMDIVRPSGDGSSAPLGDLVGRFEDGTGSGDFVLNAWGASDSYLNIAGVGTWTVTKN